MIEAAVKSKERAQGDPPGLAAWLRSQAQPPLEPATAAPSGDCTVNAGDVKKKMRRGLPLLAVTVVQNSNQTRAETQPRWSNQSIMLTLSRHGRRAGQSLKTSEMFANPAATAAEGQC